MAAATRPDLLERLAVRTAAHAAAGLFRQARTARPDGGPWLQRGGRRLLAFCSNDYLGLAGHPQVIAAFRQAAGEVGVGSGSAHLVCGHRPEHARLEEALADWTGRSHARLFPTGYLANLGVLQALLGRDDVCVQDKLNHASLIDAARLADVRLRRYPHADPDGAARQLAASPGAATLLATDGVFSMDGDMAPLPALAGLCARERATLMVDDAHGIGVLASDGAGSVAAAGLTPAQVPVLMGTLGKALGCQGAFVAGSAALVEGLDQFARTHVYTTAMAPALAAAAHAAVVLARTGGERRERLAARVARFRAGARQLGLPLLPSSTPIQPLRVGGAGRALALAGALEARGLLVVAIRPPTVPAGSARLRITFSATHTDAHVDRLLAALEELVPPGTDRGAPL